MAIESLRYPHPQQSIIFHSREITPSSVTTRVFAALRSKAIVTGELFVPRPKNIRLSAIRPAKIDPMKWILNRIGRLTAVRSQHSASGQELITPADPQQTDLVPYSGPRASSAHSPETKLEVKRKDPGVEDSLKDVPGVTDQMLVTFGEHGITSVEDLAACATDDLGGWSEFKDGKTIRHTGILDHLRLSREDCEAIIINARIKAGWIT